MAYSRDVAAAKALAARMHAGQTDKAGLPYLTHPMRVAGRLEDPEAQVVGWLHDTVEDTPLTLGEIEARFGPQTAAAVDAVSRRPGEDWDDYLLRVQADPVARQVKISDLIDNSNLSRIPRVTLADVARQARYNRALAQLLAPEGEGAEGAADRESTPSPGHSGAASPAGAGTELSPAPPRPISSRI